MNEEAKKRALAILDRRDVSRKMLLDKLTEKGISSADAEEVADWLCELGVVNDARFAELLARHYAGKGYGRRRIQDELYRHGIARELWEDAMAELPESDDTIFRLLCSRLRGTGGESADFQRAQNYLLRRGYSWEEIHAAAERYQAETEDETDV